MSPLGRTPWHGSHGPKESKRSCMKHLRRKSFWFLRSQRCCVFEISSLTWISNYNILVPVDCYFSSGNSQRDKLLLLIQFRLWLQSLGCFLNEPIIQVGNDSIFFPASSSCHRSDNTPGESTGTPVEKTTMNLSIVGEPQIIAIATLYGDSRTNALSF